MPNPVVAGANLTCSFGMAPSMLGVTRTTTTAEGRPAANVNDAAPMVNIPPFGMCQSLSNPTVASATAAALGTLTPMPCMPVITGPWTPAVTKTTVAGAPALTAGATAHCAYGGVITVASPGTTTTQMS